MHYPSGQLVNSFDWYQRLLGVRHVPLGTGALLRSGPSLMWKHQLLDCLGWSVTDYSTTPPALHDWMSHAVRPLFPSSPPNPSTRGSEVTERATPLQCWGDACVHGDPVCRRSCSLAHNDRRPKGLAQFAAAASRCGATVLELHLPAQEWSLFLAIAAWLMLSSSRNTLGPATLVEPKQLPWPSGNMPSAFPPPVPPAACLPPRPPE